MATNRDDRREAENSMTPVVDEAQAIEDAYLNGYHRFEGMDRDMTPEESEEWHLGPFKESATWANNVAPRLRAAAGFADGGMGTYTKGREIVVVPPEYVDDEPALGVQTDSYYLFETLVEAFDTGAYHAAYGDEKGDPYEYVGGIA